MKNKEHGKPLILLHGNEEDHRIFDEAIELLKSIILFMLLILEDMVKAIKF